MPYLRVGKENSGDIELYYEDHGSGQPVVLIHGWPLSSASWEKQLPLLLDAGHRVIAYDRRGFGRSSRPAFGYDYDTFARDLHELLTALDLRDVVLVGFSMGTGECARYLGTYGSERVSKVAFISSLPPFLLKTPDTPHGVDASVIKDIQQRIARDRPAYLSEFFADFYNRNIFGGERISDEAIQLSWNVAADASGKATLDCVQAWLTDFRQDLPRIDVPTLVVHGEQDRILPLEATGPRLHEAIPGSRFVLVRSGPHGIIWTHAEEVNRALLDFLNAAQAPRRAPAQPQAEAAESTVH